MRLSYILPLVAMTLPLGAQEAPAPVSQTLMVAPVAVQQALESALEQIFSAQSEDLYPAALAVLEAGGNEVDFYRLMHQAAEKGNPVAQKWSAYYVLQSAPMGDITNAAEAVKSRTLLKSSADAGYVPAMVEMARYAGSGIGAPANEKEGMQYLMNACKSGSSRARAAYLLLTGRLDAGKFDSPEIASELNKNNYHLEEIIASMYGAHEASMEWMQKASDHGSPAAPLLLAQRSETEAESLRLLQLAAERHQPEALAAYGAILLSPSASSGLKRDEAAGTRNLQLGMMLGYVSAASTLAGQYMNMPETYSAERVFDLYNIATVLQDPRASVAYAYCLVMGRGCTPEPEKGVGMLRALADAGSPYAYVALADLYFNGNGVAADMDEAISCLDEANAAGIPHAYALIAAFTHLGNKTAPPDARRAELYLQMAEERNELNARKVFDSIVEKKSWYFLPPVK